MSAEAIPRTRPIDDAVEAPEADAVPRRHRWTRREYYRAFELGLFADWPRIELILGDLVDKMSQGKPHVNALVKTQQILQIAFGTGCHILCQMPIQVDEHSEPEPDLAVVTGSPDDYADHPTGRDVNLVVEVAETSLSYDRTTKDALYARAGVPEYWLLVPNSRTLEVRRDPAPLPDSPTGYGYRTISFHTDDDLVSPLLAPEASISVADLLPAIKD